MKRKQPRKFINKGGFREDLGIYLRSPMESNWARWLTFLVKGGAIKRWQYEPDEFEFPHSKGNRFFKPDFKVFNNGGTIEYHEIKGNMDSASKTKLKRMAKYYPMVKVKVVDKKQYYAIAQDAKSLIPNWESG
jgi:hypothetical protein